MPKIIWTFLLAVAATTMASPAVAQKKAKSYPATTEKAVSITRTVLGRHGFRIVKVEETKLTQTIYYRRGNNGRGKGQGPLEKIVIRRVKNQIVFDEAAPDLLIDIDIKLRL